MYKITLAKGDMLIDMPHDNGLGLFEACYRADIYKRHNSKAVFSVVNVETGDIEYQV